MIQVTKLGCHVSVNQNSEMHVNKPAQSGCVLLKQSSQPPVGCIAPTRFICETKTWIMSGEKNAFLQRLIIIKSMYKTWRMSTSQNHKLGKARSCIYNTHLALYFSYYPLEVLPVTCNCLLENFGTNQHTFSHLFFYYTAWLHLLNVGKIKQRNPRKEILKIIAPYFTAPSWTSRSFMNLVSTITVIKCISVTSFSQLYYAFKLCVIRPLTWVVW